MGSTKASLVTGGVRLRYEKTVKKVKAEVTLGSPSAGCGGVGICRVMAAVEKRCACPTLTTWIGLTASGRLQFAFLKANLDEKTIRRHFRWALFQIIDAYELPERINRQLKAESLRIEPGIYTVWQTPDRLIVEF